MFHIRPIALVVGIMLTTLGLAMILPILLELATDNHDWQAFFASAALTLFVGIALIFVGREPEGAGQTELNIRDAFLLTTVSWIFMAVFAALPFILADIELNYTDAFFEAMSGLTTTGSTVISGLDRMPPGILMWRALLQWLGGIGIIVTAVAVLPMLQIGGMQLFRAESSDASEKLLPRAGQIATVIGSLYMLLSVVCALAYYFAGMTAFEAVAHAMTTIATGGFSTSDSSIAYFDSAAIDTIAIIFMIIGSLPFLLYWRMVRGEPFCLLRDSQVRTFFGLVTVAIITLTAYQWASGFNEETTAFRYAAFNVISIITGTGYATTDYVLWGSFGITAFFFLMFTGGCAGSTSCGLKIFRLQVLYLSAMTQIKRVMLPHGVFHTHYNGRPLPDEAASSVKSFFFLFVLSFGMVALIMALLGLDYITAISAAATAIANVGPGLGPVIGPVGNFGPLPDMAKWVLAGAMLLGRLELFTVLVLFLPRFWRG